MSAFHIACIVCSLSQYSQGTMEMVVSNRGMDGIYADGFIAVRDCKHIGKVMWLRPIGQMDWERFVVADCSMPPGTDGAYEWMTDNRIVGEVDYETAVRWGVVGRAARVQVRSNTYGMRR